MKANELRIGNWIYDAQCQQNIQIGTGLHIDNLDPLSKPIPLTEEWLKRFGFDENLKEFVKSGISIREENNNSVFWVWGFYLGFSHGGIKHVHQLQNLYFALTGEELELKEQTA